MHIPSGTVICPCGNTEHGIVDINRHAKMGMTVMFNRCHTCDHFKPYKHSSTIQAHGCCYPVKVVEDDQSLRTKEWWNKIETIKGEFYNENMDD